jgi:hypothetical protein
MKLSKLLILLFIFTSMGLNLFGQNALTDVQRSMNQKPYDFGILIGMASYEGDMIRFSEEETNLFTSSGIAFGLNFNYHLSQNLNGGISYRFGQVSGDDKFADAGTGRRERGFSFTNNLNELSLRLEYAPLAHKNYKLTPYVYGAIGMVFGNPQVNFNESKQPDAMKSRIAKDKAEIEKSSIVFPIGFGVKYDINENYSIKAEAALRIGANDYIDGVTNAASTEYNDYYGIGGVIVCYKFGNKKGNTIKEF